MAPFDVFRNPDTGRAKLFPYLLDLQADLLVALATRVVVPVIRAGAFGGTRIAVLMPSITILGTEHLALFPELAAISARSLKRPVSNAAAQRHVFVRALDALVLGI